jgi:hypothetical protein
MTTIFILVLFIGTGGLSIGGYRTYDACDLAGRAATKVRTVDYLCIPAELDLGKPVPPKAAAKGKKK